MVPTNKVSIKTIVKMKRRILLITLVAGLFATGVKAQDCGNNPELKQKLSIFSEYAKARNYKEACLWRENLTR